MASAIKSALPSHLKPGNGGEEGAPRHHGKTRSHMVSATCLFQSPSHRPQNPSPEPIPSLANHVAPPTGRAGECGSRRCCLNPTQLPLSLRLGAGQPRIVQLHRRLVAGAIDLSACIRPFLYSLAACCFGALVNADARGTSSTSSHEPSDGALLAFP